MQSLLIVLLATGAAVFYGIAHDLVTAHACVEYFTIGHERVIASRSPVDLAVVWGALSTWWIGLPLGILLAGAARVGVEHPKLEARQLAPAVFRFMVGMACAALAAGVAGWLLASAGVVLLPAHWAASVPPDRHVAFLADQWAHAASAGVGAAGGIVFVYRTARGRNRIRSMSVWNRAAARSSKTA